MASIQTTNFVFNNTSSDEFNILLCRFEDSSYSSNDEETTINTVKTYGSDIFHITNVDYENPLKFQITICKADGTYFDTYEQVRIKKWLVRTDDYHWFSVDQDDMYNIRYKAMITFAEMVDIGGKNGGMKFNLQCNSPFAHSNEQSKSFTCTTNYKTFNFYYDSDFAEADKVLYPNITITSNVVGTIEIKNNTTNETMKFTGCTVGEVITVTDKEIPSTTANRIIIDAWNYNTIYFVDGLNNLTINGNCTVKFTYSSPKRVGG